MYQQRGDRSARIGKGRKGVSKHRAREERRPTRTIVQIGSRQTTFSTSFITITARHASFSKLSSANIYVLVIIVIDIFSIVAIKASVFLVVSAVEERVSERVHATYTVATAMAVTLYKHEFVDVKSILSDAFARSHLSLQTTT